MTAEIDITDGSEHNPNRHKHIYEQEDGTERSLIANSTHVSVDDAAESLDIDDTDAWTWVYSKALVLDGAAVPCRVCRRPVWCTVKTADINRGKGTVRCGRCVREDEESDDE